jgi:uncharacterized protein
MTDLIERTAAHVEAAMRGEGSGHDWWHVYRVWCTARHLAQVEGGDVQVVELAALLHDLGDHKFHGGDETVAPRMARTWLDSLGAPPDLTAHVSEIVGTLSFKGAGVPTPMRTLEGQIVQDADRLDALGAVGIARAFAYGGYKGRLLYDPAHPVEQHADFETYKNNTNPTINHFYEKLLLLKDLMNTPTARRAAEERHIFMEQFLARFYAEWDGNDILSS